MNDYGKESIGDIKKILDSFSGEEFGKHLMESFGYTPVQTKLPLWMTREEFVKEVENRSMMHAVQNKEDYFSTVNLDSQLANMIDVGIVLLRTKSRSEDLEEFATRKVGNNWKFSFCHQAIDDIKYGRVVEARSR